MSSLNASIEIDAEGIAWIAGANTKVIDVILDKVIYGRSPEEIRILRPRLSLAQIHAAFAHYYERQDEMDREIDVRKADVEKRPRDAAVSPGSPQLQIKPRWSDLPPPHPKK